MVILARNRKGQKATGRKSPSDDSIGVEDVAESSGWEQRQRRHPTDLPIFTCDSYVLWDIAASLMKKRKEVPHLWNLNEDPALTNMLGQ